MNGERVMSKYNQTHHYYFYSKLWETPSRSKNDVSHVHLLLLCVASENDIELTGVAALVTVFAEMQNLEELNLNSFAWRAGPFLRCR